MGYARRMHNKAVNFLRKGAAIGDQFDDLRGTTPVLRAAADALTMRQAVRFISAVYPQHVHAFWAGSIIGLEAIGIDPFEMASRRDVDVKSALIDAIALQSKD